MHKMTKATSIPKSVKEAVYERDGGRCILCGRNKRRACSARHTALTGRQRHRAEHRDALPLLPPSL